MENTTLKYPMPGYGIAIIDPDQDDGEDKFDTPQVGKLIIVNPTEDVEDELMKRFNYVSLLDKTVYWQKYADADATFFDRTIGQDIVFIKLEKIVGYDKTD